MRAGRAGDGELEAARLSRACERGGACDADDVVNERAGGGAGAAVAGDDHCDADGVAEAVARDVVGLRRVRSRAAAREGDETRAARSVHVAVAELVAAHDHVHH